MYPVVVALQHIVSNGAVQRQPGVDPGREHQIAAHNTDTAPTHSQDDKNHDRRHHDIDEHQHIHAVPHETLEHGSLAGRINSGTVACFGQHKRLPCTIGIAAANAALHDV